VTRTVREKDQSGAPMVITYRRDSASRQAALASRREQQERADEVAASMFHSTESVPEESTEPATTG
jgi:hypothetical protein